MGQKRSVSFATKDLFDFPKGDPYTERLFLAKPSRIMADMKQFSLNVAPRDGIGRGASRRVRQAGRVPAVVYGKINEPKAVSVDGPELTRLLKGIAGSAAIIELKEPGVGNRLSIIQEIQRDAMTDRILHVDLHEVGADEELEVEITVHATGDSVGVRVENGILETVSHRVRVRCLPKDLPAFIEVDVSELHVNESLHLSQLPALPGVKYIGDPNQPIFACVEPVVEAEPTPVVAEGAEAAPAAAGAPAAPAAGAPAAGAPAAAAPAAAGKAPAAAAPAAAGKAPAAAGKAPAKK
jgi:large subunit ribosomal protein L25